MPSPRVFNRGMNTDKYTPAQTKRVNSLVGLSQSMQDATTADHWVQVASDMLDLRSLGRTDRWKSACAYAAQTITDSASAGKVTLSEAESEVRAGHALMAQAVV